MKRLSKMRGTAIFMALLIVAIVATITVLLMRTQQIDIRRTQMLVTSEQAYFYAQGVVDWAKVQLLQDLKNPFPNDAWPLKLQPMNTLNGDGKIAGVLQDAEGLFNINNFSQSLQKQNTGNATDTANSMTSPAMTPTAAAHMPTQASSLSGSINGNMQARLLFSSLLATLNIQTTTDQQNMLGALNAWVNPSLSSSGSGMDEYDQQYSLVNQPYRAPHSPMVSISELRLVQGITPNMYNKLLPYLVALPEPTAINISHAPALILQAMGRDTSDLQHAPSSAAKTSSKYFLLRADVYLQDQHLVLYTLLKRDVNPQNGKQPQVNVIWQSFGTV